MTTRLSITLPDELAERVRAKVASGDYANESEVVCDGLLGLLEHDEAVERWLRDVVVPTYDRMKADPSRGVPVDEVRARLAAAHAKAIAGE